MQEDLNRTTPPQKAGGKRHRRRKKNTDQRPQGVTQQTASELKPEETAPQPEQTPVVPEPPKPVEQESAAQEKAAEQNPTQAENEQVAPTEPEATAENTEEPEPKEDSESQEPETTPEPENEPETTAEEQPQQPAVENPGEETATEAEPAEKTTAEEPEENPETEAEAPQAETTAAEPEESETAPEGENAAEEETAEEPAPETTDDTSDGETSEESEEDELEEESPEEEKRVSDITRTVQLSIEQIMSQVSDAETPSEPEEADEDAEEDPDEPEATLHDQVRSGLSSMGKWVLLVVFVVLVIAGCGVAWLYRNATPDMLPQITVKFAGETLEPTAYKWKVPVIGNVFKRTYADTLSSTPSTLEATVEQASPDFVVSPSDYRTELTVTDVNENVVFEGDVDTFSTFQFTANGEYTAKLVVHSDASSVPGDTSVTGSETWLVNFTVGIRPSIYLSGTSVEQGSVVAVRVGDTLDGSAPTIQTDLANAGFFKANTGWICYLPIPWNQAAGTQTIVVNAGGYTENLELQIKAADWEYKDYSSNSQRVSPYIGQNDIPAELQKLLTSSEDTIAWSNGGFVQPFLHTLNIKLGFGTTEYVGRSYSERSTNNGAGGRTLTNLVLNTTSGELLIAPASGKVLLAKDLGGDLGYALVIDHGAGVKSIFYNLQKISVKAGDSLKQGQTIATCGRTTVAEMRIGNVPIDPLQVWRGQCNALKYY